MLDNPAEDKSIGDKVAGGVVLFVLAVMWTVTIWSVGRDIAYSWGYHWERGAIEVREEAEKAEKG